MNFLVALTGTWDRDDSDPAKSGDDRELEDGRMSGGSGELII